MFQFLCHEHHTAIAVDARARMNVRSASWLTDSWMFTTKPYANQRPSGAPPG